MKEKNRSLIAPLFIFTFSMILRKIGWSFASGLILLSGIWLTASCLISGFKKLRHEKKRSGRWIFTEEILFGICFALILFNQQYWIHAPGFSRIAGILLIAGYLYKLVSDKLPSPVVLLKNAFWPSWFKYYFIMVICFLLITGIFLNPRQFHNFFRVTTYEEYLRSKFPGLSIEDGNKLLLMNTDRTDASRNEAAKLFELAKVKEKERDYSRTLRLYNLSIDKDPENAEVYFQRGRFKISRLELNKDLAWSAVIDFSESIRLNPDHAAAYFHRGAIYSYLDEKERACQDMHVAYRLNPEFDVMHFVKKCCPEDSAGFISPHL